MLLNYYRDGRDSIAWHADDELELGPNPTIVAVSFGAERGFEPRQKNAIKQLKCQLLLLTGTFYSWIIFLKTIG